MKVSIGVPTAAAPTTVSLQRPQVAQTADLAFWALVRRSSENLEFPQYESFMNNLFRINPRLPATSLQVPFPGVDPYRLLKVATEIWMMGNCGILIDFNEKFNQPGDTWGPYMSPPLTSAGLSKLWQQYIVAINGSYTIPYLELIKRKLADVPLRPATNANVDEIFGILTTKVTQPCFLELIWSYWHEEGMLVQTLNAISMRFQNRRAPARPGADPLQNLALDPLRGLNNLLWGYIQDEQHRLSLPRRVYEYDHHYGLRLHGRAVGSIGPAESRSKFLEAFHNLLHLCAGFYKEADDTTVMADAFPVLNALKEVHLLLTEGQHNQYGDLPWNARLEMLMQQWLLARPETREFLPSRVMVAYPESWMDRVDSMKRIQGWTDVSSVHFRNLGVFGERLLLTIRYGNWNSIIDPVSAYGWAMFWRAEIQSYIHDYRVATGVDLTAEPLNTTLPSELLRQRLARARRG